MRGLLESTDSNIEDVGPVSIWNRLYLTYKTFKL